MGVGVTDRLFKGNKKFRLVDSSIETLIIPNKIFGRSVAYKINIKTIDVYLKEVYNLTVKGKLLWSFRNTYI